MTTTSSKNPNYNCVYPEICDWAKEELKTNLKLNAYNLAGVDLITGLLEYAGENVYLSGGLLSMLVSNPDLDKIMTDPQLLKSDIDLYILGSIAEKKTAVDRIIQYLNRNRDDSRNEIKLIGWTGSVIYIVTDYEPRIIQLILMDEVYQTMDHVIAEFDLDYVALYYNRVHNWLVISARCAKAIYTKVTGYKPTRTALSKVIYRGMKAVDRGYTINPESTRQMVITAYDVGKDIPELLFYSDYPENALDADIIKVDDGVVVADKITYKFKPGFNWDIMYLRYYTHCWNYMNNDYLSYNDVIRNTEYMDESGKLDINMLKYYYKTEYSIKNIWLGSTLPDESVITDATNGMKQIFWRGMNNIGYYICQTGQLIKKPAYEHCEKLGPQLLDNPDLLDKIMPASRFKEGREHSFGGHIIYMPFHDTNPIVVNGIFGKMENGGANTITISFILSPNSRDYIFALQRQLQRYINLNINLDPALKHTGLQKIIKPSKKTTPELNKAKYGFNDKPDETPATSIAPYTIIINVADMTIDQFLKKYPVNTGKPVSLCLDFTCYLMGNGNYGNVNTDIRYKYKLHLRQPFIKGDAGACQPNSGLIIQHDFDILRKHITGPHTLYDLTGKTTGNAECNIKPLDLSAIPELVSNSMVRCDRYFHNLWTLIKDDTLINADRPNTTYNRTMSVITNTICQDMTPDTSLIIEFKQPPISINHGNYKDYARRLMPTYIKRVTSSKAEKDLLALMKHIGQSRTEYYSSGLLGELTDESYAKVQALFKAINPTGYGSELYEELYGIYNCHDLYPGKKNMMYLKVESMHNTIYNPVQDAKLSGQYREFFHNKLRTKFVVKIRTYPIHIDVSKLLEHGTMRKYVNHTIAHLYLFNVNLPCVYIDMTGAYNKVPQPTIDYLDDNKIWLSMACGMPQITNAWLDSRIITKETVMTCDYMDTLLITLITGIKRIYPAYCPIDFVLDISANTTNLPDGVIPNSTKLYTISLYIDKQIFTNPEVLSRYFRDTGYTFRNHLKNINYTGCYTTEYAKHKQSALEYLGVTDISAHYEYYSKQLVTGLDDELPPELIYQIVPYVFRQDSIRLHVRESLA